MDGRSSSVQLPLREAYPFASRLGLWREAQEIERVRPPFHVHQSLFRRALIAKLFIAHDVLDTFIKQCWPHGATREGRSLLRSYERLLARHPREDMSLRNKKRGDRPKFPPFQGETFLDLEVDPLATGARVPAGPLAALLPVNMGNRGQNVLPVAETALKLARASPRVRFLAYHWRISGNFVYRWIDETTARDAVEIGQQVAGLRCLARTFEELKRVNDAVPAAA
jgi:hypothetical protein